MKNWAINMHFNPNLFFKAYIDSVSDPPAFLAIISLFTCRPSQGLGTAVTRTILLVSQFLNRGVYRIYYKIQGRTQDLL